MVLSTNSSHDEWDPARPLKYVSLCEASAATVWASSDSSVKTSKWLWSRVYHCRVINVLNLQHGEHRRPVAHLQRSYRSCWRAHLLKFFFFQKENILLHVQTGNDVIFTVGITPILTGGMQKWCILWRGVVLAMKIYLQLSLNHSSLYSAVCCTGQIAFFHHLLSL